LEGRLKGMIILCNCKKSLVLNHLVTDPSTELFDLFSYVSKEGIAGRPSQ